MTVLTQSTLCPDAGEMRSRRCRNAANRVVALLREWRRRNISRCELAAFDARMLRDIGITRCEALSEITKPFWRE